MQNHLCLKEDSHTHMQEGIMRLKQGLGAEALASFEKAIELRKQLPWDQDPEAAWMLAAAWINRSEALRSLGNADLLPEAIQSLDRGIVAMGYLPLEFDPRFPDRLILAWINRATICGEKGDHDGARAGFCQVAELFDTWGCEVTRERVVIYSMFLANRARFRAQIGDAKESWADARQAVRGLRELELNPEVAAVSIQARAIQCQALAIMLDEPDGPLEVEDWLAEATDSVEEALALVRRYGYAENGAADLVRYGAKIYRICQPHFLGEFLCEWLIDGGPLGEGEELRQQMKFELAAAKQEVERRVLLATHDTAFVERQMEVLRTLQAAENELNLDR